jgi:hypothetical protein
VTAGLEGSASWQPLTKSFFENPVSSLATPDEGATVGSRMNPCEITAVVARTASHLLESGSNVLRE